MRITLDNFVEYLPLVKEKIHKADFVCIDLEFTGLDKELLSRSQRVSLTDPINVFYKHIKESVSTFLPIEFGISTFKWDIEEKRYQIDNYGFYIFPRHPWSNRRVFGLEAASIIFLRKHRFDFNQWIQQGISWISHAEYDSIKSNKLGTNANMQLEINSESSRIPRKQVEIKEKDRLFLDAVFAKIEAWLQDDTYLVPISSDSIMTSPSITPDTLSSTLEGLEEIDDDKIVTALFRRQPLILDRQLVFNSFQQLLIYQELEKKYPTFSASPRITPKGQRVFQISEPMTEAQRLADFHDSLETQLNLDIGFRHVIDALVDSRKPIILHNASLDLGHIYHNFFQPIPDDAHEFSIQLHQKLPYILDLKLLVTQCDRVPERQFPSTRVDHLCLDLIKSLPIERLPSIMVDGHEEDDRQIYNNLKILLTSNNNKTSNPTNVEKKQVSETSSNDKELSVNPNDKELSIDSNDKEVGEVHSNDKETDKKDQTEPILNTIIEPSVDENQFKPISTTVNEKDQTESISNTIINPTLDTILSIESIPTVVDPERSILVNNFLPTAAQSNVFDDTFNVHHASFDSFVTGMNYLLFMTYLDQLKVDQDQSEMIPFTNSSIEINPSPLIDPIPISMSKEIKPSIEPVPIPTSEEIKPWINSIYVSSIETIFNLDRAHHVPKLQNIFLLYQFSPSVKTSHFFECFNPNRKRDKVHVQWLDDCSAYIYVRTKTLMDERKRTKIIERSQWPIKCMSLIDQPEPEVEYKEKRREETNLEEMERDESNLEIEREESEVEIEKEESKVEIEEKVEVERIPRKSPRTKRNVETLQTLSKSIKSSPIKRKQKTQSPPSPTKKNQSPSPTKRKKKTQSPSSPTKSKQKTQSPPSPTKQKTKTHSQSPTKGKKDSQSSSTKSSPITKSTKSKSTPSPSSLSSNTKQSSLSKYQLNPIQSKSPKHQSSSNITDGLMEKKSKIDHDPIPSNVDINPLSTSFINDEHSISNIDNPSQVTTTLGPSLPENPIIEDLESKKSKKSLSRSFLNKVLPSRLSRKRTLTTSSSNVEEINTPRKSVKYSTQSLATDSSKEESDQKQSEFPECSVM